MTSKNSVRRTRRGVVICGAYGMGNSGDDAVLSAIVAELRRHDRDMPITVLARRPGETAQRFGVNAVHPLRILRWMAALRRSRLFLSGGGSLLQDVTSRRSLAYYLLTIRLAKRLGCAVQLYGCGIGPLRREESRRKTAEILNACADAVTLRDADSEAFLKKIGVESPRILLAADPAMSLPSSPGDREKGAAFVLRDWPGVRERLPDIAACARYIWETYRREAVVFCLASEDRPTARELCRLLEDDGVPVSVSVDARRIGRMSLVVSMRLHGLVFALRDGAPAMGLSYDPKVKSFCAEAGFPCVDIAHATDERLCALADETAHLDGEELHAAAERMRRRERVNGRVAAELLSG